jgi:phosphomannomutase
VVTPASAGATALIQARTWAAEDPDPVTRAELEALIARAETGLADAAADLVERFSGRLAFGTAGLRGELGAGPMRMNRVLVIQAAAGLADFLLAREPEPSVVIGYDGRHNSAVFARDSAEVLAGAGVRTVVLPRALPTPVLAFAVRHLGTSAGVMVTASHNPARDNGYKVYLGGVDGGSQIVPPADHQIESAILGIAARPLDSIPRSAGSAIAGEDLVEAYVRATAAVARRTALLRYVYSALHGVGREVAERVFAAAGFPPAIVVTAQAEPDPDFPTVAFPNPEEPGAMDLAFATAEREGADLVIANDPDADRVAVGVPGPQGWRRLTGNEVGWLLGWRAARDMAAAGRTGTLACSLVSSPALREVARVSGLGFAETLTGFKWISRAPGLAYGYEEALGYLVDPDKVRDKDGISAAAAVLSLFAELRAAGITFEDHLADFADRFGAFSSGQISIRVADLGEIGATMERLRSAAPREIGGLTVTGIDDFASGFGDFPPSDLLRFHVDGGSRVIVRPSGTEPKLKCYLDASSRDGDAATRWSTAHATVARLDAAMRTLLEA